MNNSRIEKNWSWETNLTYQPLKKSSPRQNTDRSFTNVDKQNVIPCGAQMQTFISTLNQKKYDLKNVMIEKQKFDEIVFQQANKLDTEKIKQTYEVQRQIQLLKLNTRTLDEIEALKKEKLQNMQKMLSFKKCLQSRFQQIMEMKKLMSDLLAQGKDLEEKKQFMERENEQVTWQTNQLDLMNQSLDNDVFQMKETVRQSQVQLTTTQSALNMIKHRIQCVLSETKNQNKQTRALNTLTTQVGDKIKKRRQQRSQNEINSQQLTIKNRQIQDINIKLRNDLQKCKGHLQCLLKNNDLLSNNIEEFDYMGERVSKLIHRNELKKL